jgi:hypothetical protein
VLLNRYLLEYTALSDQVAQLEVAVTVVPPEVQPLKDQSQIAQDLTSYLAKLTALVTQVRALETATAGETPAITPLVEQSQAKQKLANFSEAYISKAQIVEALTEADLLVAPSPNLLVEQATATQKLAGWSSKVTGLKASLQQWLAIKDQVIPETTPLDGFANVGKLVAFASKLQKAQISVEGVEAQYTEILATEAKVQVEVQGLGTCPTCTRPFHLGGHT